MDDVDRGKGKEKKIKVQKGIEKIVGGQLTDDATWPFLVSISQRCFGYDGPGCDGDFDFHVDGKGAGHLCGGTAILDGTYVITGYGLKPFLGYEFC